MFYEPLEYSLLMYTLNMTSLIKLSDFSFLESMQNQIEIYDPRRTVNDVR